MDRYMEVEMAEQLACPFGDKDCLGLSCMAWRSHPHDGDLGYCALIPE